MAYRLSAMEENVPFDVQIRNLPDETLLDIWEEMQQVQSWLSEQYQQGVVPAMDYERMIVHELQRRSCDPVMQREQPTRPVHDLRVPASPRN